MKASSYIIIVLSLIFCATSLDAQVNTLWVNNYTTNGWDSAEEVQQTRDGGFIIVGVAGLDANSTSDLYLIRTDSDGIEIWSKMIEGPDSRTYGTSVQETEDGGFILTGHKEWDVYLAKTDSLGDLEWTRTFGDPNYADCGSMVRQTEDGGYIVTGYMGSNAAGGEDDFDVFLLKTDSLGKLQWLETYGDIYTEQGFTVDITADGGYFINGYTNSASNGSFSDVYLIKTDSEGVMEWDRVLGGWNTDVGRAAQPTADGGFIVTGRTKSFGAGGFDVYLLKVDASGDTVWTNTYGGSGDDVAYSVNVSDDNGEEVYTITGKTTSFSDGDYDLYLVRVDASGSLIWEWTYGDEDLDEIGRSVIEANDGGLIIATDIGSFTSEFFDVCLLKAKLEEGVELSIQPSGRTMLNLGDVLEFSAQITNHTDHVVDGDFWLSIVLPDGNNVLLPDEMLSFPGLTSGRVFPSGTLNIDNALYIHPKAEAGTYTLVARLGVYPDFIIEEDSFEFEVID